MEPDFSRRMTADTRALVDQMSAKPKSLPPKSDAELVAKIRQGYRQVANLATEAKDVETIYERVELDGHSLPARLYVPKSRSSGATLFIHGGGFVSGDFDTHERVLQNLAAQSKQTVVAVEYRLAPERPFPAAPNDCFAALQWLRREAGRFNIDPKRIAVGGDSAGGALAIAVCLMCQEQGMEMPELLLLACPNTDLTLNSQSWNDLALLHPAQSREKFAHQLSLYVDNADELRNPLASPAFAKSYSGLPPTLVITAELDAQRDEAEEFAARLRHDGVLCTSTRYPGVIHGFWQLGAVERLGNVAVQEMAAFIRTHSEG